MIKREVEESIKEVDSTFRVLLLTGPRQVGKTTVLKNNIPKGMNYVTLDEKVLREEAQAHPKTFLMDHKWPLLIDEAQYAPELFPYIKINVDNEGKRGMYWLTGSQQFKMMKNVTESLAGRVGIIKMNSLTYAEIIGSKRTLFNPDNIVKSDYIDKSTIFEYIFKGGMPELYDVLDMKRNRFYDSYIETYITRDVPEVLKIKDKEQFKKFMIAIACRNGEQVNYSNIGSEIGINDKTVKEWLNVLVTSGLVYLLEPFRSTKLDRITHIPKIIFMDTGLCAYLADWKTKDDLEKSSTAGHYFETFIISDLIKSYNAMGEQLNISYYRDKDKNEIDLIIEKNNKLYPFEIKKTMDPKKEMISNFKLLKSTTKEIAPGGIICNYEDLIHIDDINYIIPVSSVINAKID